MESSTTKIQTKIIILYKSKNIIGFDTASRIYNTVYNNLQCVIHKIETDDLYELKIPCIIDDYDVFLIKREIKSEINGNTITQEQFDTFLNSDKLYYCNDSEVNLLDLFPDSKPTITKRNKSENLVETLKIRKDKATNPVSGFDALAFHGIITAMGCISHLLKNETLIHIDIPYIEINDEVYVLKQMEIPKGMTSYPITPDNIGLHLMAGNLIKLNEEMTEEFDDFYANPN